MYADNNQLVILKSVAKNFCPTTKTLIINAQGKRDAIPYGRAVKFWGQVHNPNNINELFNIISYYANIPYAMLVRGVLRDHVDLSKPIYRRKDARKYPTKKETVSLKEGALNWAGKKRVCYHEITPRVGSKFRLSQFGQTGRQFDQTVR